MKSDEVVAVLDALARHLGTTADFLIPLFARRAIGAALAELACISLIALIGLRAWRWKPNKATIEDSGGFVLVVKWGAVVVATFLGYPCSSSMSSQLSPARKPPRLRTFFPNFTASKGDPPCLP